METNPFVYCVILNWNSAADTIACATLLENKMLRQEMGRCAAKRFKELFEITMHSENFKKILFDYAKH